MYYSVQKKEDRGNYNLSQKHFFSWCQTQCVYTHHRNLEKNETRLPFKRPELERMADSEDKLHNVANNTVCLQIFVAYLLLILFLCST